MATKRRKSRRSCKNGKLKRPVRTKNGGKRRCRKTKRSRKRRSKTYKVRSTRYKRRIYRGRRAVPVGGVNTVAPQMSKAQRKRLQKARRRYRRYLKRPDVRARKARTPTAGFAQAFNVTDEEMRLFREAYPNLGPAPATRTFTFPTS